MTDLIFKPKHEKFTGKFPVYKPTMTNFQKSNPDELKNPDNFFIVDLARGLCTCPHGAPFVQATDDTPIAQSYCKHKIIAIAGIVKKDPSLMWPYIQVLATRYNKYEVVSAFHKELRRGDYERAIYWASILSTHRGIKGVIKYLLNILYEETRDHGLGEFLLSEYQSSLVRPDFERMKRCVAYFCNSPKKWELEGRLAIFNAEMDGYKELAKRFSYRVAQSKEIVDASLVPDLTRTLLNGFADKSFVNVQIGLKGLFKAKSALTHEKHKDYIFGLLEKVATGRYPNGFQTEEMSPMEFGHMLDFLKRRKAILGEHGYHELNAFADLLRGEPYAVGILSEQKRKAITTGNFPGVKPGVIRQIPLYAQDNHTWVGKAYLRRFKWQLGNGIPQTDIDFRMCGAYLGVAWRYLAFNQHGTIDVPWEEVKWPLPLHTHVMKMFY
jgi:hypothetical protein